MCADFLKGCSWHATTLDIDPFEFRKRSISQNTGLSCPIPIYWTIPSMIHSFIVFALARPLFHLCMRPRLSAKRLSHPYGFKPQRAANPSSSSLNISSRKLSVPGHVQLFCTKYMDSLHKIEDPAFRWLMTWAPRRLQQNFRYL
jgi:hypothetical protein